ncbi:MAG TPA: host attachment protein [Patescibacteria group bacterium]|nr:host attachment protein [Patescibacteria group bacterium]
MRLPEQIQHFIHPTLLVLADHVHAKIWFAHEDEISEIAHLTVPHELKSDNEGSFMSSAESVGQPEQKEKQHHLNVLIKHIAEALSKELENRDVTYIDMIMPADILHPLELEFPKTTIAMINRRLEADLIKEDILQVAKRLFTK